MSTQIFRPEDLLSGVISISSPEAGLSGCVREEASKSLFLFEKGELVNVRLLSRDGKMVSRFFCKRSEILAFVEELDPEPDAAAIYAQLQVLNPESLADISGGGGVKRHHVSKYRWFVVDIDTLRPDKAQSNATDDEKLNSLKVAIAVSAHLQTDGWPQPILCDSGNGWHLVWKIDLENTQENYQMLRRCLVALDSKFSNEHGEIDCSLAEPEQIIKLWGTMVRKGEDTPLRPWRRSCVVEKPETVEVVPTERIQWLASQAPVQQSAANIASKYPSIAAKFDPEDFFEWCQENLPDGYQEFFFRDSDADRDDADGHHYVMDGCFWAERKHSGDRKKTEFILGKTF